MPFVQYNPSTSKLSYIPGNGTVQSTATAIGSGWCGQCFSLANDIDQIDVTFDSTNISSLLVSCGFVGPDIYCGFANDSPTTIDDTYRLDVNYRGPGSVFQQRWAITVTDFLTRTWYPNSGCSTSITDVSVQVVYRSEFRQFYNFPAYVLRRSGNVGRTI